MDTIGFSPSTDKPQEINAPLSVSVVINTNGRLQYLKRALESLERLRYNNFEVCVVCGPTDDGSADYLHALSDRIKVAACAEYNLSISRNIGIAMSAGDIVAFIDDDSVAEPEWLSDLTAAYEDNAVGAAGGFVYDHTGTAFQAQYVTTNRLGYATNWTEPSPHLNFPMSLDYPHLLGTNCSFRRSALLEIGGFDNEFEYFLDETDVCCRINDAGFRIVQLANAFVHHKYAPSYMRDERRIVKHWYPLIKNRVYFGIRNGHNHHSLREIVQAGMRDVASWERSVVEAEASGVYTPEDVNRFSEEADLAIRDAVVRGFLPAKRMTQTMLAQYESAFKRFVPSKIRRDVKTFCFVTQDYPPGQNGGIARNISQLARSLAADGNHIHVLTKSRGPSVIDFEDGVWVHRVAIRHFPQPNLSPISPLKVPGHIWNYGQTMLEEVAAIKRKRRVDVVYCPLWDCEPLAFVLDGSLPLIVALQTTMKFWLESQPLKLSDEAWMQEFGLPIIAMEELILDRAPVLHANSKAIVRDIASKYDFNIDVNKTYHSPHGMEDWAASVVAPKKEAPEIRALFVGRLESRKGIDVLLKAVPSVLKIYPNVVFDIVGDDTITKQNGKTYKEEFFEEVADPELLKRVIFHGRVDEMELRQFYASCDLFVAPSRYESFGLVFLEAMMFGKPVIACNAGGGPEVVTDSQTGFLVDPGDVEGLAKALEKLIRDSDLRGAMGLAARADYLARFTDQVMVRDIKDALTKFFPPRSNVAQR